jgi:hypothetical protein
VPGDVSAVRLQVVGYNVDKCRFPRAVRTKQRVNTFPKAVIKIGVMYKYILEYYLSIIC